MVATWAERGDKLGDGAVEKLRHIGTSKVCYAVSARLLTELAEKVIVAVHWGTVDAALVN